MSSSCLMAWITCECLHLTQIASLKFESDHLLLFRDMSNNNLSGQLPPSVADLLSLTTLWVDICKNFQFSMFHIYQWVICIFNFLSSDTCRTINFLGCLTLYRIFRYQTCTILTSSMIWKKKLHSCFLFITSNKGLYLNAEVNTLFGNCWFCPTFENLLTGMQEYREQPIFWTYTCKVVGHSKFQVNLSILFRKYDYYACRVFFLAWDFVEPSS